MSEFDTVGTSARLRDELARTQERLGDRAEELLATKAALAASQADLTRAERQRDGLLANLAVRTGQLKACREHGDLARAELASARTELEQLRAARGWQVMRGDPHPCAVCPQRIERGQAFEPTPAAHGWFQHVHCPDPKPEETPHA